MQELFAFIEWIVPYLWNLLQTWYVWNPSFMWLIFELGILAIFVVIYRFFPKSGFYLFFESFFEQIHTFFEEILWDWEKKWIKVYITLMFFVILFSNILWVLLEFFVPMFWEWVVASFIMIPTADINFNVAMALIWVIIVIIEQFKALWFWKTIYEYVPVFWKDYIPYSRWALPAIIDWPLFIFVKACDILISIFLWLLDIVWHVAKVISLSFRLFWNMISGWILLAMLTWAVIGLTQVTLGIDFPVIGPLILYIQALLVAFIQALVFPLLIAIFIKVAKVG